MEFMFSGLFNIGYYWPDELATFLARFMRENQNVGVFTSTHALDRCRQKAIAQAATQTAMRGEVVEVEFGDDGKLTKLVTRQHRNDGWDVVCVVDVDDVKAAWRGAPAGSFAVATAWVNRAADTHQTLREERCTGYMVRGGVKCTYETMVAETKAAVAGSSSSGLTRKGNILTNAL